ncbi:2-hydroxyacid dehydrogenase [Cupriavidus sp. JZ107]
MSLPAALPVILVVAPLADEPLLPLARHFDVVRWRDLSDPARFLAEQGARVTAVIASGAAGLPAGLGPQLPNLSLIACNGVGYDGIDMGWARERGVVVTNTPDVLSRDVADLALALLLAVFRQIPAADRFVREGRWSQGPMPLGRRLAVTRIGVLGLGRIGKLIAQRCLAFDTEVSYCNRQRDAFEPYDWHPTPRALAGAVDVLIVATPGGAGTERLVSRDVLEALGPDGVLINIARGSVVDEEALVEMLQQGALAGAGLDVFAHEPEVPAALAALPNVVLTPHIASATVGTRRAMADLVVANAVAFAEGRGALTPVT